jgi:DNA-binding MarR family transcriptional regulator
VISARALGVYMYLQESEANISAENLARIFSEGRKTMLAVLKELREAGYIKTTREVINGKYITVSRLTDGSPKSALLIQQSQQNSNLILNNNSFISKKIVLGEAQGGDKTMSDEWYSLGQIEQDPEEIAELKRRDKERRDREYREARNARAEKNMASNINRIPAHWTVDNAVYEFARRMIRWDIPPWEGSRRPFQAAFARSRKDFNTNGEIEIIMMDIFFGRLDHEKKIKDPDMVWRLFIRDYNSLKIAAEQRVITPDSFAEAQELSDRQMEKF